MPTFLRGARPTPRHKLLAAPPHRVVKAPPPQFAVVPKQLDMWGNNQYGDCVSAEEAFAKAAFSVQCGLTETFIPTADVVAFASQNGFLDGANLTDVMDVMKSSGMASGGQTYKDGSYSGVDYSNEAVLQSALTVGPVKIAIDANALPQGAGNQQGWYATGGNPGQYGNTDHCVGLCGYGPASYLFQQLGVPLPSGVSPTQTGYLLFTWSTIGFVDHAWLMSTCTEAWVRNPTTVGQSPSPTPTPPSPPGPPTPVPPPPPTPTYPAYTGSATGTVDLGFPFGTKPLTLNSITLSPAANHFHTRFAAALAPKLLPGAPTFSLSIFIDVFELLVAVRASGNGQLIADARAVMAAIGNPAALVPALEKLAADLMTVATDPLVLAALNKVLADLGMSPLGPLG